ncbi:MAG: 2-dehydropantoate 2-reductase [Candidatus Omnitrophica bacterium]|nr:2-dehydropantoate 2-reductase [Candidatus Omnitrophota bacterium]MDD5610549.1 2-dehydropantoate 2-reductase [Candidatus Omnitrophota bacterium]
MKIVIVGPGAMGCLLAAYLAKSKEEIWLFDKNKERAEHIDKEGISVEGISGAWRAKVNATTQASDIKDADLVIICVKSYHTKQAVNTIKPLLAENTTVLSIQNGIGNIEIISEGAGSERVIAGSTNMGATLLGYGSVRHAGKGETVIGRLDGKITVEMRRIREIFNRVGLETKISRDIKGLLWSKLIINVGINALTAITRLNNGRLVELVSTRTILKEAVNEAVRVAKKKRIKLIYDDPLAKVEAVCEATAQNTSSMLQDVLRKKSTEIDFINGVIVRQAEDLGMPATVNSVLVNLVKAIESSYDLKVEK